MSSNLGVVPLQQNSVNPEAEVNEGFGRIDASITETLTVDLSAGNGVVTLVQAQSNIAIVAAGATEARAITLPQIKRVLFFRNPTEFVVTLTLGTTTIAVDAGRSAILLLDGTANGLVGLSAGGGGASYPVGGTTGQVLKKKSDNNNDVEWANDNTGSSLPAGGTAGQVLKKKTSNDGDVEWAEDLQGSGGGGSNNYVIQRTVTYSNHPYQSQNTAGASTKGMVFKPLFDVDISEVLFNTTEIAGAQYALRIFETNANGTTVQAIVGSYPYVADAAANNANRRIVLPSKVRLSSTKTYVFAQSRTDATATTSSGVANGSGSSVPWSQVTNTVIQYSNVNPQVGDTGTNFSSIFAFGFAWLPAQDDALMPLTLADPGDTGELAPIKIPKVADFEALINPADITLKTIDNRGISMACVLRRDPTNGFARLPRSVPASGNFAVVCAFKSKMHGDQFPSMGMLLHNTTNNRRTTLEYLNVDGLPKIEVDNWSSDNGFVAAQYSKAAGNFLGGAWFRFDWIGSVLHASISADGVQWLRVFSNDSYLTVRPDKAALFLKPSGGTGSLPLYLKALFYHFEIITL